MATKNPSFVSVEGNGYAHLRKSKSETICLMDHENQSAEPGLEVCPFCLRDSNLAPKK